MRPRELCFGLFAELSTGSVGLGGATASERQRERRGGAVRLVLDRLEAGVRAGACSDPSKSRGIDNPASPVEAAAVDQRRNACPVGERTVASMRHDGQEPQPRPCPGRLVLKTRPDSVAVTGRCSCFAAGEQQYLLLAGAGTAVLPLRRAKEGALRAPSRSCASRPLRAPDPPPGSLPLAEAKQATRPPSKRRWALAER